MSAALAVAILSLASQFELPLGPVPLTLQTLAVVLTGFVLGPHAGFAATALWLACGAAGLPVFAGGDGGIEHLTGTTAGYLLSFPVAAAIAGYGAERLGSRHRVIWLFLTAVAAHALTLAAGAWWLSTSIGADAALEHGVLPFLSGALLKSAVAALVVALFERRGGRARRVRAR